MIKRGLTILASCVAMCGHAALAQDSKPLIGADDPNRIVEVLKGYGSAAFEKDKSGDPHITGRMQGIRYSVFFYGCTDGKSCRTIQFRAAWRVKGGRISLRDVNAWNLDRIFGKAYLDKDGDPTIEMPIALGGATTQDNLEASISIWQDVMQTFEKRMKL
jgi:hypothetical protein